MQRSPRPRGRSATRGKNTALAPLPQRGRGISHTPSPIIGGWHHVASALTSSSCHSPPGSAGWLCAFPLLQPAPLPTGKEGAGRKGLPSSLPQPTNSRPRPPRNPSHPRKPTPPTSARTNKHIHLRARKSVLTHLSRPQNRIFFFPFPRNHLHAAHTPSQPPLCARNTPSARKYGGPTSCTCASLTTTATSSNSSKRQRATCKPSRTPATCATTKSSGGPANPTSPRPWPKLSPNRQSQHPSQPRPCPRPSLQHRTLRCTPCSHRRRSHSPNHTQRHRPRRTAARPSLFRSTHYLTPRPSTQLNGTSSVNVKNRSRSVSSFSTGNPKSNARGT